MFLQEKLERNRKNLKVYTADLFDLSLKGPAAVEKGDEDALSFKMGHPLCMIDGWEGTREVGEESFNGEEEMSSLGSLVFMSNGGTSVVRLIKLPYVEKIPPYTTWIFLDK